MIELEDMYAAQIRLIIENMKKAGIQTPDIYSAFQKANKRVGMQLRRQIRYGEVTKRT